jgi:hypothetical protein
LCDNSVMANNPNAIANLDHFKPGYDPRRGNRKPVKFLTQLLISELKGKEEIVIEGEDFYTGEPRKIRITKPTKTQIIAALLKQAQRGNVNAIREVLDRVEGKVTLPIDAQGLNMPINLIFNLQQGNDLFQGNEKD